MSCPSWIRTYTGRVFDFDNIEANEIELRDITWALTHTCRFGGHALRFYSVAEHTLLMHDACMRLKGAAYSPRGNDDYFAPECHTATAIRLGILLHDAAEAYIGDIVGPLKKMLPGIMELEQRILAQIYRSLDVDFPTVTQREIVHEYDQAILANECTEILLTEPWDHLPAPLDVDMQTYSQTGVLGMHVALRDRITEEVRRLHALKK